MSHSAQYAVDVGDSLLIAKSLLWSAQASCEAGKFVRSARLLGGVSAYASVTSVYLNRTNELRVAKIEGRIRSRIGDRNLRNERLIGSLSNIKELIFFEKAV